MPSTMFFHSGVEALDEIRSSLRGRWGWFVALGVVSLVLGLIAFANVLAATFVSVLYLGILMIVAGAAQIFFAFPVRTWGSFLLMFVSGVLYCVAGAAAFYNPLLVAGALTLLLAITLIVAGVLRLSAGIRSRQLDGWGWLIVSGTITLLVGIVLALGWPANALWALGTLLAADLTIQGFTALMFGLTLRPRR
jgi:uncharacterized membrane protein HdeD (DUF308 family)